MTTSPTFSLFDVLALRREFPILQQLQNGKPLAFLDSAASSQKPRRVIDCLEDYYKHTNANVHRGVYRLSEEATFAFERARGKLARFIGAASPREVVFTRNTTEAINLVARAWGDANLRPGDRVLLSMMEHHSNLIPWQMLAQRTGAELDFLRVDGQGRLVLEDLDTLLTERTRLVAITHQSNVLGTINPVAEIARRAHEVGALVVVDASQAAPQLPIDLAAMPLEERPDLLVFTGHKVVGPTGVGVLWGRRSVLEALPPFLGGGEMIETVTMERSTYAPIPHKFEAGTPPIAEVVGLGAAVEYLGHVGLDAIRAHEHAITGYVLSGLATVPGVQVLGPLDPSLRGGAVSFEVAGIHPHDLATVLDTRGVAVRAGHHCARPAHARFGVQSSTRMSSYLYTTPHEIDELISALHFARDYFRVG